MPVLYIIGTDALLGDALSDRIHFRGALSGGTLSRDTLSGDALSGYAFSGYALSGYVLSERMHIRTECTFTPDAHRGSTNACSLTQVTHSHGMNRYDIGAYSFQLRILFT